MAVITYPIPYTIWLIMMTDHNANLSWYKSVTWWSVGTKHTLETGDRPIWGTNGLSSGHGGVYMTITS